MAKRQSKQGQGHKQGEPGPGPVNEKAEQLLGQMMFSVGMGAAGVHISRSAVARMRRRYATPTYTFVNTPGWELTWEVFGIHTLRWFAAVGRLAAELATVEGSPAINGDQFEEARLRVERTYRLSKESATQMSAANFVMGDICPYPEPPPIK